jgi:elongation factor G
VSSVPILLLALEPKTAIDRERLHAALARLIAEDSTLHVRVHQETNQLLLLAGTSEKQLENVVARLRGEFGVELATGALRVIYKEMFSCAADGEGRFARQSGGRGQFAHAKIHVLPGESGSGCVFVNAMEARSIPTRFIGPTERGIREALDRRSMAHSAFEGLIDVRIELYDGSYHDVDSTEMTFKIAGGMAFEDAAAKARPVLMEPVMRIDVAVPSGFAGGVIADLAKRRGSIQAVDRRGEMSFITARIPLSMIIGYEPDGATFSVQFDAYEPCLKTGLDDDEGLAGVRVPRTR